MHKLNLRHQALPGIGELFEVGTSAGPTIRVIHHRSGRRDLAIGHPDTDETIDDGAVDGSGSCGCRDAPGRRPYRARSDHSGLSPGFLECPLSPHARRRGPRTRHLRRPAGPPRLRGRCSAVGGGNRLGGNAARRCNRRHPGDRGDCGGSADSTWRSTCGSTGSPPRCRSSSPWSASPSCSTPRATSRPMRPISAASPGCWCCSPARCSDSSRPTTSSSSTRCWELTSVTSFLLIGNRHTESRARAAALHALLVTSAGGLALLGGLVLPRPARPGPTGSARSSPIRPPAALR